MAEIDETAILERAKMLAEKDGLAWELEGGAGRYSPISLQRVVTDEQREQYLARARAELEAGDA